MTFQDPSATTYLESAVRTAPPARLRLMLIERGVGLCESIAANWRSAGVTAGNSAWDEQSLRLSDILTELLSGVGNTDVPVAKQVADLYVFLIQHLDKAHELGDVSMIDELHTVLQTEAETWRMVCAQQSSSPTMPQLPGTDVAQAAQEVRGSLNLQG